MKKINKAVLILVLSFLMSISLCSCGKKGEIATSNSNYYLDYENKYDQTQTIYVIGHLNPDSDTICTSIAYAYFLNQMGYKAEAVLSGQPNAETQYVLGKFGVDTPEIVDEAGDRQYILVDHSDYGQSIAGMKDANVIGVIDHHAVGNVTTANPIMYVGMPVGCTSTIVFQLYEEHNIKIPEEMAGLMMSAILSDTMGLKSLTTTEYDKAAVNGLSKIAGIKDYASYTADMLQAGNILDSMTIDEILNYDYKKFTSGDTEFSIAEVQSADADQLERIAADMDDYMKENFDSLGVSKCYVMMTNQVTLETKLLCYGEDALEYAQKAFNTDSDEIILENTTSRKKQIAPPLMEVFENN